MLIEAHTVEPGARIQADICVIGTGPAGMTLLKKLSGAGLRLVALESGGREFNSDSQALCDGATTSPDRYPAGALTDSRRRQLGGTAHLWNDELDAGQGDELVRLVPLDPIDFTTRAWVPYSGWPFGRSDLQKFYEEAFSLLGLTPNVGDSSLTKTHRDFLRREARLATVLSRFAARTVFTRDIPKMLAGHEAISVYLNATSLELVTEDSRITHVRVASGPGREFYVAANLFVLAAGGIENARILLLSNRVDGNGVGNQHDLVGRFFMDHPSFRLGLFTPSDPALFRSAGLYDHHVMNGQPVMGKFTFGEDVMRQEKMLNICVTLTPRGRDFESAATQIVKRAMRSDSVPAAAELLGRDFRALLGGADELFARLYHRLVGTKLIYFENKGGWSRLSSPERRFRRFELNCLAEQAPNPENRVKLTEQTDRFGQRKAELHWKWSEVDLGSIHRAQEIVKEELEQQRLGVFVTQREIDESDRPSVATPHHHIGTTRMHNDPRQGVVDSDCRVHGISNLYVAGSSVFPTGGFANPTLTIIALALRLSYHLKELMKPAFSSVSTSIAAPTDGL